MRAAIATIADLGYRSASFAQIAKRAGLPSTGLISYHFDNRDDLIQQVVTEVVSAIGTHRSQRMPRAASATVAVATYRGQRRVHRRPPRGIGARREEMKALLEIFLNGGFDYGRQREQAVLSPIDDILRRGHDSGEFREFDPKVMATLIRQAVDGLPFLLSSDPGLDVGAYAAEAAGLRRPVLDSLWEPTRPSGGSGGPRALSGAAGCSLTPRYAW